MFKKSLFKLWILIILHLPGGVISAQIIPGQTRADVETYSGTVLWEEETPILPGQVHQVLYAGQSQTGSIPVLALYVNDRLLLPIFFVPEDAYMKIMSRLQANPEMTQQLDDENMISFISADGQYSYKLSTVLMHGGELSEGLVDRKTLMHYLSPASAYAIMHVDYHVVNNLGYNLTK